MGYYIGIDAGGTNTRCVLADDERELARVIGGTVKVSQMGEDQAAACLVELLQEASRQAGIPLSAIGSTCFGLAGVHGPGRTEWALRTLRGVMPQGIKQVCEDADIALDAAFPGGAGVLVISGTGSNVMARNADDILARAGGLGGVISDEGSGTWIGRQAVAMALFVHQGGGPASHLLTQLLAECHCESPEALMVWANHVPPVEFSKLAPVVQASKEAGDLTATTILDDAGRELARLVRTAIARLPDGTLGIPVRVAFTGSILEKMPSVKSALNHNLPGGATLIDQAVDPVVGAVWRAWSATRISLFQQ